MSDPIVLGAWVPAPARPPLCGADLALVPLDLLTQWRRCGMIADFLAGYVAYAFERRETAHSVLSTTVNELVENVAKFSADKREGGGVALRHQGDVVVVEACNLADAAAVARLGENLAELAAGDPGEVFARRVAERRGLGLALIAKDTRARMGATVTALAGGLSKVVLRAVIPAEEVEAS